MANIIKIKRGLKADVDKLTLLPGELGVTLDTQELYVGDAQGNKQLIKGAAAGIVESAEKLATARNITMSGDAIGTAAFDGSKDIEIALALANSGVSAGTYSKVTVDEKGRVTTGAELTIDDLPTITIENVEGLSDELAKYVLLETYNTDKEATATEIAKKADKTELTNLVDSTSQGYQDLLTTVASNKATIESDHFATTETVNSKLATKADKTEVASLNSAITTLGQDVDALEGTIEEFANNSATKEELVNYVTVGASGGYSYTYDGVMDGKVTGGGQFFKISDDILTPEELMGATVVSYEQGEIITSTITSVSDNQGIYAGIPDNSEWNQVYSVYKTSGLFPETGIYVSDLRGDYLKMDYYVISIEKAMPQEITGAKNFTGDLTKNGVEVATVKDLNKVYNVLEWEWLDEEHNNAIATDYFHKYYEETEDDSYTTPLVINLVNTMGDRSGLYYFTGMDFGYIALNFRCYVGAELDENGNLVRHYADLKIQGAEEDKAVAFIIDEYETVSTKDSFCFPYELDGDEATTANWNSADIQELTRRALAGEPFSVQLKLADSQIYNGYIHHVFGGKTLSLIFHDGVNHMKIVNENGVDSAEVTYICYSISYNDQGEYTSCSYFNADKYYMLADPTQIVSKEYVDNAIAAKDSLPSQANNAGKFLTTNGTTASWAEVDLSSKADKTAFDAHVEAYDAKVAELEGEIDTKAAANNVYTKAEIDETVGTINTNINKKANSDDVYTKTAVDELLADKADTTSVYTKVEADGLLNAKANATDVYKKTETYTQTEVNNLLSSKANATDVNAALELKATKVEVEDLEEALNTEINKKANSATTLAGYGITDAYTKTEVDGKIAGTFRFVGEKASLEELNAVTGMKAGDVYQVGEKEYAYDGDSWVELGFNIDLSAYAKSADVAETYATKADMTTELGKKANSADVYTKNEIDTTVSGLNTAIGAKANSADVYTQTEINTKLEGKADKATTLSGYGITDAYTKNEANAEIAKKADKATTLAGYNISDAYTKTEVDNKLTDKLTTTSVIDGGSF